MKCPSCEGEGAHYESILYFHDLMYECDWCEGNGRIPITKHLHYLFWNWMPVWFIEWYDGRRDV